MIGLISATAAGAVARDRLAAAWPGRTRVYDGPVREAVGRAFTECDQLVCFLATGAVVRLVAPLLGDKAADPGVVCVDEARRHAVSLIGGHGGGANALAFAVSDVLGCAPVITTATDATDVPGLDTLGWPVEGATAAVTRAILDGAPVTLEADAVWPLPPLPGNVTPAGTTGGATPGAARNSDDTQASPAGDGRTSGPGDGRTPVAGDSRTPCADASPTPLPRGSGTPGVDDARAASAGAVDRPGSGVRHGQVPGADDARASTDGDGRPGSAGRAGQVGSDAVPAVSLAEAAAVAAVPVGGLPGAMAATVAAGVVAEASVAGAARAREHVVPAVVRVSDRVFDLGEREVVLRPPSLVVGVGASKGASVEEVFGLVEETLADAGLSARSVAALATVDAKADEAGIVEAAARLGVPLRTYAAEELARIDVPNPSGAPLAAVGTPSVAEAAALVGGGELLVPKRKSVPATGRAAMATCAVVRKEPRGRLAVVGLGPGARDLLTPRAREEIRRASVLVGLDQYVDQIRDLLRPGTRVLESGLGAEEERARTAVAEARAGHAVALIGSGDAGVYAMASPALAEASDDIDVVGVPGVTAALAAAAILGAPLGHDHVSISLSDLHTPWEVIERRVRAAAEADIVVTFYNPRSRGRDWQLPKALSILAEHREPTTPVGVVRNASRPDGTSRLTTIAALDPATVDMMTVVVVGNTAAREIAGRMVTPRGYRWQTEGS
ncbi:precorrin-3B C(17)-methyltransferase [Streptomyces flavidovirens]|uniref:precorrin-3B C(17)-methyltransferase n=1 Tax=Streptomyces flavidovirens TaxID=67298 RepID=UPI0003FBF6E4|nr:precorrin-3B C(17)-methyltransferase [Streptomyces flavidovirens]